MQGRRREWAEREHKVSPTIQANPGLHEKASSQPRLAVDSMEGQQHASNEQTAHPGFSPQRRQEAAHKLGTPTLTTHASRQAPSPSPGEKVRCQDKPLLPNLKPLGSLSLIPAVHNSSDYKDKKLAHHGTCHCQVDTTERHHTATPFRTR